MRARSSVVSFKDELTTMESVRGSNTSDVITTALEPQNYVGQSEAIARESVAFAGEGLAGWRRNLTLAAPSRMSALGCKADSS